METILNQVKDSSAKKKIFIVAAAVVLLVLLPVFVQGYWLRVITSIFMYCILAESVNIIAGYSGYPALGNVVFFGTGAYVTAVLMKYTQIPFIAALIISGVMCALYAFAVGLPILRLRGRYFLMATVALLGVSKELVANMEFTGGGKGITLPVLAGSPRFIYSYFYYVMLAIMLACILTTFLIERNRIGYALRAIKFDEDAAGVMGINTTIYKVMAWSISALFTGMAGSAFAYWMTYIDPRVVFDMVTSVSMYLMFVFGGAGTLWGPILGAIFIELLSEVVWSNFLELHYLVLGSIMVFVVLFMPKGLIEILRKSYLKLKTKLPNKADKKLNTQN